MESHDDKVVRFPSKRADSNDTEREAANLTAGALKSGWLTQGSAAARLQETSEAYFERHVVPVAGGSAALHLALLAIDVGDGREVILPAISSPSIANLVILAGGRPTFADIEAPNRPFLEAADANRLIGPDTRAVLTVHEAGYPALTDGLRRVADDRGLTLLEDCRSALGATVDGRAVGAAGALSIFAFGDSPSAGGLLTTSSESLERHLIALRSTVIATDDECFSHDCADGMVNGYRIDEAAASAGARSMAELADAVERRHEVAAAAAERLVAAGLEVLGAGANGAGAHPNWQFLIALAPSRGRRDQIVSACRSAGLEVVMPVAAFTQQAPLHRRALPNTRVYCDLGLKLAVVPGIAERLATIL